jgi:hypothetical protein
MATKSTSKYPASVLEEEVARPKKTRGRQRKYTTEEEKKEAISLVGIRCYWRKKCATAGTDIPEEFALRKRTYQTDDERKAAHLRAVAQYHARNREEHRLSAAVSRFKRKQTSP